MDEYLALRAYLTSLGIGLLLGLERERAQAQTAGLRTFALAALAGTSAAALAGLTGTAWIVAVALAALAMIAIVSYLRDPSRTTDPGTTTLVALLLCYLLGALCWYGQLEIAVALAVTTTALLYFKPELHGFSHRISGTEMRAFLQFAAVAFLLLPLLPNREYGPWAVINPFRIGLLVVLISGLSLAGYAALKLFDRHRAIFAIGVLGGAASSTATTLAFARHARAGIVPVGVAALIVALANLSVLVRLGLITAAAAPRLLPVLAPILGIALIVGTIPLLLAWRRLPAQANTPDIVVRNPAELRTALAFALLFALVLLISAGVNAMLGPGGLFAVAAVSGLTDVDAISLSAMQLLRGGSIDAHTAAIVVCIAFASNLMFKLGTVAFVGGRAMALAVAPAFTATLCGLAAAVYTVGTSIGACR